MWETPALVISDDGAHAVDCLEDVELFFAGAKEQYSVRGITDTRADLGRVEWLTDRIVIVDVRWPYLDMHGNELGEECSTYALRLDDDGAFKLRIALLRGMTHLH
jgi:hypothetical protein